MKPLTNDCDRYDAYTYIRPSDRRFSPTAWERMAVVIPWVNCDPVARHAVEGHAVWQSFRDSSGYPTA
ncbi:hypothetical protein EV128_12255 [Rhizobium azibense]|nr:hypothetical protein EV128_12255 [Rhizobium azibense]